MRVGVRARVRVRVRVRVRMRVRVRVRPRARVRVSAGRLRCGARRVLSAEGARVLAAGQLGDEGRDVAARHRAPVLGAHLG